MIRSLDGAECPHGVNVFNPRGCPECDRLYAMTKPVEKANGHVPSAAMARKIADNIREKTAPTESD